MSWKMKCMDKKYLTKSLDLVERVFTESENAESGNTVRRLVEEIRSKRFYLPELELIMTDEMDEVIGYAMFSGFHLEGRYEGQYCCFHLWRSKQNYREGTFPRS